MHHAQIVAAMTQLLRVKIDRCPIDCHANLRVDFRDILDSFNSNTLTTDSADRRVLVVNYCHNTNLRIPAESSIE